MTEQLPEAFIYMKVGNHAGESFETILARKNREGVQAGRIFWGYGGTVCHPLMQVQPFARLYAKRHGRIYLFMEPMDSQANPAIEPAREYSDDGVTWYPLPDGISVLGSKYALVLDTIQPRAVDIGIEQYVVGVGPSRGKNAAEYLQGRIDKGCFTRPSESWAPSALQLKRSVKFSAQLLEPYAVLLR